MNDVLVKDLIGISIEPTVSVLCSLDSRRPGNSRDARVLAELRDDAVAGIRARLPGPAGTALVAELTDAIASVDLEHPSAGVAVLVAPGFARVVRLAVAVQPEVIIGRTFATRALVSALMRPGSARVLVLAQGRTRCFDVTDGEVAERHDHGFPVDVEAPTEQDTPHRNFPLGEHEHAEAAKFVFRAVDHALSSVHHREPRPLVLVGAERDLAYFDEVTSFSGRVVGRIHGNHERATPGDISELVKPVFAQHVRAEQEKECQAARDALGRSAVAGLEEVWTAAREGRGRRLIVEDDYRFDARVVDQQLRPAVDGDRARFDAVDDAIDAVLRHNGDVVPVPAGMLDDLGHIALLVRY